MQLANVFTCQSPNVSIFTLGFISNRLVLVGITKELDLAAFIINTSPGNALLGCLPINNDVWMLLVPFALFLRQYLQPGYLAVDATCGNGKNALEMARLVGESVMSGELIFSCQPLSVQQGVWNKWE